MFFLVMPCGFSVENTHTELLELMRHPDQWRLSPTSGSAHIPGDASSYFSRPGPRLIDGIELLVGHTFHPQGHDHIHESIAFQAWTTADSPTPMT